MKPCSVIYYYFFLAREYRIQDYLFIFIFIYYAVALAKIVITTYYDRLRSSLAPTAATLAALAEPNHLLRRRYCPAARFFCSIFVLILDFFIKPTTSSIPPTYHSIVRAGHLFASDSSLRRPRTPVFSPALLCLFAVNLLRCRRLPVSDPSLDFTARAAIRLLRTPSAQPARSSQQLLESLSILDFVPSNSSLPRPLSWPTSSSARRPRCNLASSSFHPVNHHVRHRHWAASRRREQCQ